MRGLATMIGLLTAVSVIPATIRTSDVLDSSLVSDVVQPAELVRNGHIAGGKAHGSVAVQLDPNGLDDGVLIATVNALDEVERVRLEVVVLGDEPDSVPVELLDSVVARGDIELPVIPTVASGVIEATVSGFGPDSQQFTLVDRVWFRSVAGELVTSEIGIEDLDFRVADALSSEAPVGTASDALVVGAGTAIEVADAIGCSTAQICAAGRAEWSDRTGEVHPVSSAYVDLVELTSTGRQIVRTTVVTDSAGRYEASFPSARVADVFVRVRAAGPGFEFVVERSGGVEPRTLSSSLSEDVAPGSTVEATFRAGTVNARDTVFSLHAAMTHGIAHVATLRSRAIPDVEIVFPSGGTFYSPSSEQVHMLELDRWDWDVMLHEYGHHVAEYLRIESNPGGRHSGSENLGDRLGKSEANRLAWGEGWPTYFAVSALLERGTGSLDIPGVGDTVYQDTEDTFIVDDLEDNVILGEDNELTVASTLWDLYDEAPDGIDRVALGSNEVWDVLDQGDPATLSAAVALFAPDRGARSNDINCVLSQTNVAPLIFGTESAVFPSSSPTVNWWPGNGGRTGFNDSFTVEYRDAATSALLHAATTTDLTYRATAAEWESVTSNSTGDVEVSIVATAGQRAPITGPYRSCARAFEGGPVAPSADLFVATTPERFLDTRSRQRTVDGLSVGGGPVTPGEVRRVQIAERSSVPGNARAAIINLTAAAPVNSGYVVAFDCSTPVPLASSLNFVRGQSVANEIVVALSGDGELCLAASSDVDLVLDVVGHVEPASPLVTVTPARILETRPIASGTVDGSSANTGPIRAGVERRVVVAGRAGVPRDAVAAIVNVAAVSPSTFGFVTVSPCTDDPPLAASLNVSPGVNRADEIVAPLDADGAICIFSSGQIDAVVDVVAFVPPGSDYLPTVPARFVDTRANGRTVDGSNAGSGRLRDGEQRAIQIAGRNGIPDDAVAVTAYVTSVRPGSAGYFTVWPCDGPPPLASSVNHHPGVSGGNELLARLDASGSLCIFTRGDADLTLDISGHLGA